MLRTCSAAMELLLSMESGVGTSGIMMLLLSMTNAVHYADGLIWFYLSREYSLVLAFLEEEAFSSEDSLVLSLFPPARRRLCSRNRLFHPSDSSPNKDGSIHLELHPFKKSLVTACPCHHAHDPFLLHRSLAHLIPSSEKGRATPLTVLTNFFVLSRCMNQPLSRNTLLVRFPSSSCSTRLER